MILERNGKDSLHPKPYPKSTSNPQVLSVDVAPESSRCEQNCPNFGGLEIHHPDVHLHLSNIELRSAFEPEKNLGFFGYKPPQKKSKHQKKYLASIHHV